MQFKLQQLDYSYEALAPHIGASTVEVHHSKHHRGYLDELEKAIGVSVVDWFMGDHGWEFVKRDGATGDPRLGGGRIHATVIGHSGQRQRRQGGDGLRDPDQGAEHQGQVARLGSQEEDRLGFRYGARRNARAPGGREAGLRR